MKHPDPEHLAFGWFNGDFYFNKLLVEYDIIAEVIIHEINEYVIGKIIYDTYDGLVFVQPFAHNLNAESLDEFEALIPIKKLGFRRSSDVLTDIDGKTEKNKESLAICRKLAYVK